METADALDAEWFATVLEADVVAAEVEPIGGGLMARMVRARLSYAGETGGPASIIVKFPTDDPGSLGVAQAMGLYEQEVAFYRDLASLLPDLHAPRCFGADVDPATGAFTLLLEDLSATTRAGDVLTESSVADCAAGLVELVALQAPLWNSPAFADFPWLADRTRTVGIFDQIPLGLAPFLDRFGDKLDPSHVALFERYLPRAGEWVRSWSDQISVVQHGDFRSDNLLFGLEAGAPATVIDFQTVRTGPPGLDPAYLLASSLSVENRRSSEAALVAEYHDRLIAAGVAGFDRDSCWTAYRAGAMYGVFLFVGMAGSVESTERGDRLIVDQISRYAAMAVDLDAPQAAGLT